MLPCNFFEDLMLALNRLQSSLYAIIGNFYDFERIDVTGLLPSDHIHFPEGSLA